MSVDPLGELTNQRSFLYVESNPISLFDSFGLLSMDVSKNGAQFIARHERFIPTPYNDPSKFATIGYGHLIAKRPVNEDDIDEWGCLSKEEGLKLFMDDLRSRVNTVNKLVKVNLTQNQFDALVSFVFNAGEGNFQRSTLLKRINSGQLETVPDELNKFVYSNKKRLPGLVKRRVEEGDLFINANYSTKQSKQRNICICKKGQSRSNISLAFKRLFKMFGL